MEMEPWLQTLLTILGTILASSGFWAYIQERSKRKAAENKHNNLETQMLIGLAHDRIIYLGMAYIERGYITGTTITLTRGDTFEALVSATKRDGTQYIPVEGDVIRFAMKENYDDPRPLLVKDIPIDTMMLVLEPQDTADLNFGKYVYDIQLTKANGKVDTFISKATLKLSEEVD